VSFIGNKTDLTYNLVAELKKQRLASSCASGDKVAAALNGDSQESSEVGNDDMIATILSLQYEYAALLSLSGQLVTETSTTKDMRKAYLVLSRKCHPDKHRGNADAKKAFQALVTAFDLLSQPEMFKEDGGNKKERTKQKVFARGNDAACYKTRIECPRCGMEWRKPELGLEDVAYNFFMMGIKQYVCGRCACQFGCMTSIHKCPGCHKPFEYHPNDYHR